MSEKDKIILRKNEYDSRFDIFRTEEVVPHYGFIPRTGKKREVYQGSIRIMGPPINNQVAIYIEELYEEGITEGMTRTLLAIGDTSKNILQQMYDTSKAHCERIASIDKFELIDETPEKKESQLVQSL
ncbi:hypothetical protein HY448_00365 [Candidatus Pacearchaeota archaeon]|nr:hypothetical protein [Candidatus Pacearchaeota archaeon]